MEKNEAPWEIFKYLDSALNSNGKILSSRVPGKSLDDSGSFREIYSWKNKIAVQISMNFVFMKQTVQVTNKNVS